ncbi:MAG: Ig-like domain-containing protein [Longimicrobiales bacterium]
MTIDAKRPVWAADHSQNASFLASRSVSSCLGLVMLAAVVACDEPASVARLPAAVLQLRIGESAFAPANIDINATYRRRDGNSRPLFADTVNADAGSDVSLEIDLTSCLNDSEHAGSSSECMADVVLTLFDADVAMIDRQQVGPLLLKRGVRTAAQPVSLTQLRVIVSAAGDTVRAGQAMQFSAQVRRGDGTSVTGLPIVWSSSDQNIAMIDVVGRLLAVAPGTVTITADARGRTGNAILTVIAAIGPPGGFGANFVVDSIAGAGAIQRHNFAGAAGDIITLRVTRHSQNGCCFEPSVVLSDPAGGVIAQVNAAFGSGSVALTATLPVTGNYALLVRDRDNLRFGRYGLSLHRLSNPVGAPVAYGDFARDSLLGVGHLSLHTIAGAAGDVITLRVTRHSQNACCVEPSVALYDPTGAIVTAVNAAFGSGSVALTVTLPRTGTHALIVRDRDNLRFGRYGVSLHRLSNPVGKPVAYGDFAQDSLIGVGHLSLHTFVGVAGHVIMMRVTRQAQSSCCFEPSIALYASTGQLVAQANSSFGSNSVALNVTLPTGGTYAVLIRDRDSAVFGRYGFSLMLLSP